MNVIRIYDDRRNFYNILRDKKFIDKLIKNGDIRVEYCTVEERTLTYSRYCFPNRKGSTPESNWDLNNDDTYYVFLDTLWLDDNLPEGETKRTKYKGRVYPYALGCNLKHQQVISLTVYTTTDETAAKVLLKDLQDYKKDHPGEIHPRIEPNIVHVLYSNPYIDEFLKKPLIQGANNHD